MQGELVRTSKTRRIALPAPAWLPDAVRAELATGKAINFCFSRGERKILRKKKPVPVAEWAEKYRVVALSSIPGRWRNLFTPYLEGIMNAAGTPGVETVIICKSPQTGGSEAGHNLVGWCIDMNPGPVLYVFPDENTARENSQDRIIPMILNSKRLASYLTGSGDDVSSMRINLAHMPIYLGWSGSVARLGNKPVRTLILDELDKYQNPKAEASSEVLAEKRTTTWRGKRHIFKISTPTTEDGPIWRAFTREAGARFDYWVRCPHCGQMQLMKIENITWPDKDTDREPDGEEVLAQKSARYACEICGGLWRDEERDLACRRGEWRERESGLELYAHLARHKPVKVGFHIPAWLSYFVSLSEVARAILKHKRSGRLEDLKDLQNQYKAEPWKEEHALRSEDAILALCDERPAGAVPGQVDGGARAAVLLAGVDTQKGYFRYVIRAFGYGENEESWLIKCGAAPGFEALERIFWGSEYLDAQGGKYHVAACMIDAMGNRTREVYAWAIHNRGRVFPWQGARRLAQPYSAAPQEYFPDSKGNKVKIPGGMNLWRCDATFFKSDLARKLAIRPEDPGAFHLHTNSDGMLEQYAREMCAEVWDDEKQGWENPSNKPNHYWDCEVMCLALAHILNVRFLKRPEEEEKKTARPAPARARSVAEKIAGRRHG